MPNKCKDKNGNYVDCETLKALQSKSWKTSDDVSRGTEMREIYKPQEITRKDPSVYDKLQKEIESGFAESKYGFTGTDLNEYIKAKNTQKEYRQGPSKNKKQNEDLVKINKKGADISTVTGITGRDIEIIKEENKKKENTKKEGEGKKIEIELGKSKTTKPKGRRSLFNKKTKFKPSSSRRSLYKCPKKGCVAKGERSIKKFKKNR